MKDAEFVYLDDGEVKVVPSIPIRAKKHPVLIPGFYTFRHVETMFGSFTEIGYMKDLKIPKSAMLLCGKVIDFKELKFYFSEDSAEMHRKLGFKHKVGYFFKGIQGSGKTTVSLAMCKAVIKSNQARVFIVKDKESFFQLHKIMPIYRAKENFLAVIMWDECEEEFRNYENAIKPYLDGVDTLDNSMMVCSTNHFNRVPVTISKRPSRFKKIVEVSEIEHHDVVYAILDSFNKLSGSLLEDDLVRGKLTNNYVNQTIDTIKNGFITSFIKNLIAKDEGKSFDEVKIQTYEKEDTNKKEKKDKKKKRRGKK